MSVSIRGQVLLYGPRSSGKTTLAVTASTSPSKVTFIDGDNSKGKWLAKDLGIKDYIDLAPKSIGMNEVDYMKMFLETIDKIDMGREVIIVDNPDRLFLAPDSWVKEHRELYRKYWSSHGPIKGPQEWLVVSKVFLRDIYAELNKRAQLVIFCAHEKPERDEAGVLTSAYTHDVHKSLVDSSGWVVRMTKNWREPNKVGPVGLQIKPLPGKTDLKKGTTVAILPDRIAPLDWPTIRYYIGDPFGARTTVGEHEEPDKDDIAIMQGALNKEQRKVYELNRMLKAAEIEEEMQGDIILALSSVEAPNNHLKSLAVVKVLKDKWPGMEADDVKEVIDSIKEVATNN